MSQIYAKQLVPSSNPLDILDFSMIEGADHPLKYPSQNGQDSLYQQLLSNTVKVSNKCIENNSEKLNVPVQTSTISVIPYSKHCQDEAVPSAPTQKKIYECPYCPYKSTRSCNLTNHLQTHYLERPYADPSCTYCSTLNNYKIDRMSSNLENQVHPCSQCSKFSSSVEAAVKHLKSHLDASTCICTHSQINENDSELYPSKEKSTPLCKPKKSLETSKETKTFECPNCTYVAHRAQNLKRHLITHTGERPHSCTICPYRAPDVSSLRVHMKTHTGERPHACPHCPYKAAQKSTLRNHLRIHTGEKPYPCTYCSYRSSNQANLNSHIKTHTGERPYSCPHCSYSATQSSALKCHLRIHTGEKPFACSQCPYKAAALGSLRSHTLAGCHKKHQSSKQD